MRAGALVLNKKIQSQVQCEFKVQTAWSSNGPCTFTHQYKISKICEKKKSNNPIEKQIASNSCVFYDFRVGS